MQTNPAATNPVVAIIAAAKAFADATESNEPVIATELQELRRREVADYCRALAQVANHVASLVEAGRGEFEQFGAHADSYDAAHSALRNATEDLTAIAHQLS
ncbi:hypothetical protein [Actinophytocola sp.]|uniref:hypothetical protein n=1 Tax=Actinophytocola sp. TaxID=1872138 RepID=UPI002ED502C6